MKPRKHCYFCGVFGNETKGVTCLFCFLMAPGIQVVHTQQQNLLRGERFTKQSVMLPHDIVSVLYAYPEVWIPIFLGEPGRIEKYWSENIDLLESLNISPGTESWYGFTTVVFSSRMDLILGSADPGLIVFNCLFGSTLITRNA